MKDNEKISIVIVTHNHAGSIIKALESASRNLRPPDHIVVGDDDSTDDTYAILCSALGAKEVEQNGQRGLPPKFDGSFNEIPTTIFRKRKSNTAHSLNVCLHNIPKDTTIVGFLDANDWYAPDKIIRSIQVLKSHPAIAVVVSDCDMHCMDGRIVRSFKRAFDQDVLLSSYPYDRNFFIRTTVFNQIKGLFNEKLDSREDYDLLLRASEVGLVYHVPEPLHNCQMFKQIASGAQQEEVIRQLTIQRRKGSV